MRKLFSAAAAAACVAWLAACQAIKIESFDQDMKADLVTAYREAPAIVDQQRIASDFWRIYDGKVVMTREGFHARRSYELLPMGLQSDFRAADYDKRGRLAFSTSTQNLLWGLAYTTQRERAFDERGAKIRDDGIFGLLGGLLYLRGSSTNWGAEGTAIRDREFTSLLTLILQEKRESVMTDLGRRESRKILFCRGLLGWAEDKTGASRLYLLFIPIPIGGSDLPVRGTPACQAPAVGRQTGVEKIAIEE